MGCDIYIIVERKYKGRWVGLHSCEPADEVSHRLYPIDGTKYNDGPKEWTAYWKCESRNYKLFGHLAGVRTDGPAANGLPDDLSDLSLLVIDARGKNGHSHCHYTLRDCGALFLSAYAPQMLLDKDRYRWLASFFKLSFSWDDPNNETDLLDNTRLIFFFAG